MPKVGFRHSAESIAKLRASLKNRPGHAHTAASKEKIRLSHLGMKASAETRLKMRKEKLGRPNNSATKFQKGCSPWNKLNISNEERARRRSWVSNKRNRVVKRLRAESLSHTFGEWELLKSQYGFTCPACGRKEPTIHLTEDHIIPLSMGGTDLIINIQPLCLSCNCKKHAKVIRY